MADNLFPSVFCRTVAETPKTTTGVARPHRARCSAGSSHWCHKAGLI